MGSDSRQKYNFLVALIRQVKEAARDGDEVYEQWCELLSSEAASDVGSTDRLDAHAQWLAALETRVEDVESGLEHLAGEEADSDDDGDDDEDVRGDEPRMGGESRDAGRRPTNLARAGDGSQPGRRVSARTRTFKNVRSR